MKFDLYIFLIVTININSDDQRVQANSSNHAVFIETAYRSAKAAPH
jgi:hypothetical protein